MFQIIVDDARVQAAFARLQRATGDLTPAMSDIGEYISKRVDDGFRKEQDFYGVPWAPLSAKTLKRKQKNRRILKVLQETGLFRASFSYTADRSSVEIGSNRVSKSGAPLGLFFQLGTRRMPKRETLPNATQGLPPADSREIVAILEEHITGVW
jgi:phage gpG-like protein